MIEIDIPYRPIIHALYAMINQLQDRRQLMGALVGIMHGAVEDNFQDGGRPRWVDLHPGTKAARAKQGTWPGQILIRSGQLVASLQDSFDNDHATVSTNKAYAAMLHFGGQTRPHVIRPRFKRALAFGGVVVRQVNHPGSKIPARPFMTLTEGDAAELVHEAQQFILGRTQLKQP